MANGLNLLVIVVKGLRRDLTLPVTTQSGYKPEEEEEADDKYRQQERGHSRFSRQGEGETFLLRTDRDAFQTTDTFTVAYGLSGGDLDGARADRFASFAVNAQLGVALDLKGAEEARAA